MQMRRVVVRTSAVESSMDYPTIAIPAHARRSYG